MSLKKTYPINESFLRAAIRELAALQNWAETSRHEGEGTIIYRGELYGLRHEYRFTLTKTDPGALKTSVRIETDGPGAKDEIEKQFLLLEKIMASEEVIN